MAPLRKITYGDCFPTQFLLCFQKVYLVCNSFFFFFPLIASIWMVFLQEISTPKELVFEEFWRIQRDLKVIVFMLLIAIVCKFISFLFASIAMVPLETKKEVVRLFYKLVDNKLDVI